MSLFYIIFLYLFRACDIIRHMAEIFEMDASDLKRLQKFYKNAPKIFMRAAAGTLNAFALGTRKQAIKVIDSKMTVRNPKFIHGSIQVDKARGNVPLGKLEAITGSVARPRYTGLAEQELGTTPKRNRVLTTASREGNMKSQVKGWARLKPQAKYPSPNQPMGMNKTQDGRDFGLQGLSGAKRIVAFLMILNERKTAQTFIIRRQFGRFKRGLYRFKQGVIKKIQSFDTKHKPKRIRWLTEGRNRYFDSVDILKVWADNIRFHLKKRR